MTATPDWTRSTYCSGGNCVEVTWSTAANCTSGSCVQVAHTDGAVFIRQSADPTRVLEFTPDEWTAFVKGVNAGEFRSGEDA